MAENFMSSNPLKSLEPVADSKTMKRLIEEVKHVKVHKDLITYIITIIDNTRKDANLSLGASPRATLKLMRASQGAAFLKGRDYCIPDDILHVIKPVLAHRLILSPDARLNKLSAESVLSKIIARVSVPILP